MSMNDAFNFCSLVISKPEIRDQFVALIDGKTHDEKAAIAVEFARRQGFELTPEEINAARDAAEKMINASENFDGELSDEDLEAVAGGSAEGFTSWLIQSYLANAGSPASEGKTLIGAGLSGGGPAGVVGAAVGGAMNKINNDPTCQSKGINSNSIGHEIGHEIVSGLKHAFSGW